jgi:molybdate-binding protein/DNA-binding XRE family transcriptional regulator
MSAKGKAEAAENVDNRLRMLRQAKGLSHGELARMAGVTRQAIYAIEGKAYLPTTGVALRLARALDCRVEDIFTLYSSGEIVEGEWIDREPMPAVRTRVKLARMRQGWVVKPSASFGDVLTFTVPADGLILQPRTAAEAAGPRTVRVELLRDRRVVEAQWTVAGCDPAIFLLGDYLRRRHPKASVIGWTMGSSAALDALKSGHVHMAGLHLRDAATGENNLPYLRRHLRGNDWTVVTFAEWQQGWLLAHGNPKGIRGVEDLARKSVRLVRREEGSGAHQLLATLLSRAGMPLSAVRDVGGEARSHLEVGRLVAAGQADIGIGVEAVARLLDLEFVPLQTERYDLVMPTVAAKEHAGIEAFLDTLVSRPFRAEIEALGGYDTHETGTVHQLGRKSAVRS